ncbi:MAG: 23S rRNA (uracil(1939)-C(5))-methyltransferase RlmD [Lachnospiraceae bacterium]|nr:23S rRNA (uracil(1939)-C(5))-methyltransferase RlmD [Lachnospiraceae bacterium]
MKKGQEYIGKVVKYEFPNKGIVEYIENNEDGEIKNNIVVKGALEGQKVKFLLTKKRHGRCEGRLLEVVEKSPLQGRTAFCPHFDVCGGCVYQEMDYDVQKHLKADMVKNILDEVIENEYEFEGILGSPYEWEYRNKMEFSFGDEYMNGPLALGLHKKGSFYDIVSLRECRIVNEDYNKIVEGTLKFFKEKNVPFYHKMKHIGYLRHLLVRRSIKTGEILVALVTASDFEADECMGMTKTDMLESYKNMILSLDLEGEVKGILHIINDGLADTVASDYTEVLFGEDFITEKILGLEFKISAFSFFQTNSLGAEVLYEKARSYVGETKDKVIFDLYSGTGTIAQMLAPVAKKVVGVEIVEEAVAAAVENTKLNNLTNCEFIAGDVLKVIDEIKEKPDLIVLDPPRDGINPKALNKIIDFGVDRLVYISCKPTSLARDLVVLQERGYRVEKVCAVDMFPQTTHVETVCLLSRKAPV